MKIALIEDEADCYEVYKTFLENAGHKVHVYEEADNVVENLDSIARNDIVILDLMLQLGSVIQPNEANETGTAIYKRLRNINSTLPIVIVTARLKHDIWNDFKGDDFVKYIEKPISDLDEFISIVTNWS